MKLHNPLDVAANNENPLLMILLVITVVLCFSLFIVTTLHFFGPWFLLTSIGLILGGRILYAVFKGK
jgi:hypothetical protein